MEIDQTKLKVPVDAVPTHVRHDYDTAQGRLQEFFSQIYSGISNQQFVANIVNIQVSICQLTADLSAFTKELISRGIVNQEKLMKDSAEIQHKMFMGLKRKSGVI